MGDKSFTVDYLKDLDINEIGEIGMALGLSFATVRALSADNYRDEMVVAWLSRKDKVGTPTWKLLGVELQKLGKNDIAERIVKGMSMSCMYDCILHFHPYMKRDCFNSACRVV